MKKLKDRLSLKSWLLVFLGLALFVTVLQINESREPRGGAQAGEKKIEVAFYNCSAHALIVGEECYLSALVRDENNRSLFDGYRYDWSISSDGSLGELIFGTDKIATLKVREAGKGDLVVRAISVSTGEIITRSIAITALNEPLESDCQRRGSKISVTPLGGEGKCHDVQQAIDVAQSGDEIWLSPGTYQVKSKNCFSLPYSSEGGPTCGLEINGKNNLRVLSSYGSSILEFQGSEHGLVLSSVSNITLRGLSFQKQANNAIYIVNSNNIHLEELSYNQFNGNLILAEDSDGLMIARNVFYNYDGQDQVDSLVFSHIQGVISNSVFTGANILVRVDSDSDLQVLHNTFNQNRAARIILGDNGVNKVAFKNNLVLESEGEMVVGSQGEVEADYNSFWNVHGSVQGLINLGMHNMYTEPKIDSRNLCLMPGSPLIGAGENGGNIGAYSECRYRGFCSCSFDLGVIYKSKGDANCDNRTDQIDYNAWFDSFIRGSTKYGLEADLNCSGKVSIDDYEVWRRFFMW
ncbi:MAG: right-handed parallel beta-helix repeat-containing protein [Candidatus Shapirobacteria bacterium]